MKRVLFTLALLAAPAAAIANSYTFTAPSSLNALSHGTAYLWGLDPTTLSSLHTGVAGGQTITSVSISFTNVYDWLANEQDILYVDAFNNLTSGVTSIVYNAAPANPDLSFGPDYFTANPVSGTDIGNVGSWSDPTGGGAIKYNVTLTLSAAQMSTFATDLNADASHAYGAGYDLGFGLSPDCHYYDTGIAVTVQTSNGAHVPDSGSTMILLASGLLFVGLGASRKTRRA